MPDGLIRNGHASSSVRVCQWVPDAGRGAAQVPAQVWLVLEGVGTLGITSGRARVMPGCSRLGLGRPVCGGLRKQGQLLSATSDFPAPASKVLRPLGAASAQLTWSRDHLCQAL